MKSLKNTAKFILPFAVYSVAGIISSFLFSSEANPTAVFVISVILCICGSFLCGFLAFGKEGKLGMIIMAVLAVLAVPLWLLAMFLESGILSFVLQYSAYFFVFLIKGSEIFHSNIDSVLAFSFSVIFPALFIYLGYKFRRRKSK